MPRNRGFVPLHEPLRNHNALQLQYERTTGPLSFLNPTHAHYRHRDLADAPAKVVTESSLRTTANHTFSGEERGALQDKDEKVFSNVEYKWRSRDNRKGRHTLLVEPCDDHSNDQFIAPARTSTLRAAGQGIQRMLTQYPYWDVSYLIAIISLSAPSYGSSMLSLCGCLTCSPGRNSIMRYW